MTTPTPTPTPTPAAATLAELKAAFPGQSDFILECAEKGLTMEQANGAHEAKKFFDLKAENEKLKADLAAAKSSADGLKQVAKAASGGDAVPASGPASAAPTPGASKFDQAVAGVLSQDKAAGGSMTRGQAILVACRKHPDLYREQIPSSSARFDSAGNAI